MNELMLVVSTISSVLASIAALAGARRRDRGVSDAHDGNMMPTQASDEDLRRGLARIERQSASPTTAIACIQMSGEVDARDILRTIRVPTLVLHRTSDARVTIDAGRYITDHIPPAKFVGLPGVNLNPFSEPDMVDRIVDEVEEFLTGSRSEVEADRVLATVLFTDIVDSTKRAAELGDRQWRTLLDRHDEAVRTQIGRFRGHEVKSLGDGFLATFDGPARAVRCAAAIAGSVQPLGLTVRSGLHTGEIELTQMTSAASPYTLRPALLRWRDPAKPWCRARCAIWSRARACASRIAATRRYGACPKRCISTLPLVGNSGPVCHRTERRKRDPVQPFVATWPGLFSGVKAALRLVGTDLPNFACMNQRPWPAG